MSHDIIEKIRNYFAGQPVLRAWLFGSFSRGEETPDSDVDILVQFENGVSHLDHVGMQLDLEEILARSVDIVTDGTLFPWVKPSVDNKKKLIYERETA